jgi:hypothetical protein
MTDPLKRAFEKGANELPESEQDELGRWLLEAIESDERRWDEIFASTRDKLDRLAHEASDDFRAGRTDRLDPDKL